MEGAEFNVEIEKKDLDLSKVNVSFRSITTLTGIPFDIAKSALQKYIRRGDAEKAMRIGAEMDLFKFVEGGGSAWTNFYNRLRIIYLEDIGLANLSLFSTAIQRFDDWKKASGVCSHSLMTLIKDMAESEHSRYFSHLRGSLKNCPFEDKKIPLYHHYLQGDEELREVVDNLVWCLENKNKGAWHFASKILDVKKLQVKRFGGTRSGFLVFEILQYLFKDGPLMECLNVMVSWYKTMKMAEQFLPIIFPMYIYIHELVLVKNPIVFSTTLKGYSDVLKNIPFEIDEFVLDKHTKIGRKCGKNDVDFAVDGSLVSKDAKIDVGLHTLYNQCKLKDHIRKESEEFKVKVRAQLICSASRPDTYFAKTRTGLNVVVKGPYRTYNEVLQVFELQAKMKLFPGVNTLSVSIKYLYPDLFRVGQDRTCLGSRTKMDISQPAYFLVMNDLLAQEEYPIEMKESKVWESTRVVDFTRLFSTHSEIGHGSVENGLKKLVSDDAIFSFAIQIAFRYIFKLGDFARRNYIRVGEKYYNIDISSEGIGENIILAQKELDVIKRVVDEREEEFQMILQEWWNIEKKNEILRYIEKPLSLFTK